MTIPILYQSKDIIAIDKTFGEPECLCDSLRPFLHAVNEFTAETFAASEEAGYLIDMFAARNDRNLANAGIQKHL